MSIQEPKHHNVLYVEKVASLFICYRVLPRFQGSSWSGVAEEFPDCKWLGS